MRSQFPVLVVVAILLTANAAAQTPTKAVKIGIGGPLTTTSAGFGVEMRQAVELAVDERNNAGGLDGTKVVTLAIDDKADPESGKAAAKSCCGDAAALAVVRHVNSGVPIAT